MKRSAIEGRADKRMPSVDGNPGSSLLRPQQARMPRNPGHGPAIRCASCGLRTQSFVIPAAAGIQPCAPTVSMVVGTGSQPPLGRRGFLGRNISILSFRTRRHRVRNLLQLVDFELHPCGNLSHPPKVPRNFLRPQVPRQATRSDAVAWMKRSLHGALSVVSLYNDYHCCYDLQHASCTDPR